MTGKESTLLKLIQSSTCQLWLIPEKKEIQGLLELWIVKSLTEMSRNVSWQLFIKAMSSRARLIATKAVQGSPHINLKR